jgi:prepilin-type N-terminal cleavage/methylation domain-containing protein
MYRQCGFTLVELLVVISIIGILASVIFVSFDGARESARNGAIMTELKEMQLALEVFRAQNDRYPGADLTSQPNCTNVDAGVHFAQQGGIGFNGSTNCAGFTNYVGEATVGFLAPEFVGDLPLATDSKIAIFFIKLRQAVVGTS